MEAWRAKLAAGDSAGAWDLFIARYRRLIFAIIRRTVTDDDDVSDIFADICAELGIDDLARLARHTDSGKARFSTWLVTVVHNRTIDWVRHRDGRRRIVAPSGLSPLQQQIFDRVIGERRTQVEAYELINSNSPEGLTFGAFTRQVKATFDALERKSGDTVTRYFPGPPPPLSEEERGADEVVVSSELATRLAKSMRTLPADERLAVQLFVVDELPAARVARIVGWPNPKAVYNRVYRALATLREDLELQGFTPDEG